MREGIASLSETDAVIVSTGWRYEYSFAVFTTGRSLDQTVDGSPNSVLRLQFLENFQAVGVRDLDLSKHL